MTATATTIHVQSVPPSQRHAVIFATFDALAVDDGFVIVNDHDPAPLRHQFERQRGGQFAWQYLEAGPSQWQVRIARVAEGPAPAVTSGCGGHGHAH